MKKFFSIEFNTIIDITNDLFSEYYAQNSGTSVKGALSLLNKLRNSEMHFFIDKDTFLLEKEFQQLHNFMIFFIFIHYYPFGEDLRDGSIQNCNLIEGR